VIHSKSVGWTIRVGKVPIF